MDALAVKDLATELAPKLFNLPKEKIFKKHIRDTESMLWEVAEALVKQLPEDQLIERMTYHAKLHGIL